MQERGCEGEEVLSDFLQIPKASGELLPRAQRRAETPPAKLELSSLQRLLITQPGIAAGDEVTSRLAFMM